MLLSNSGFWAKARAASTGKRHVQIHKLTSHVSLFKTRVRAWAAVWMIALDYLRVGEAQINMSLMVSDAGALPVAYVTVRL